MNTRPIKVLVIDDSAVLRQLLSRELNRDPEISVVSTAMNPIVGEQRIKRDKPDAIVLDIQMPRMDGLSFLRELRKNSSIPVVIFSAYSDEGSENALKALELGAVAVLPKPLGGEVSEALIELAMILKGAVKLSQPQKKSVSQPKHNPDFQQNNGQLLPSSECSSTNAQKKSIDSRIIAIGASTGGTNAIHDILKEMPTHCPPIVVVIHMPGEFTFRFAERLNGLCSIYVKEAEEGEQLKPGMALIAPGNQHLEIKKCGVGYQTILHNGPPVKRHKPSVDVLFQSVAIMAKQNALGVILTGMGSDGAKGLYEMRCAGAYTIAQNEETCIVFGMPNEAIKLGGVDCVLSLDRISDHCIAWMTDSARLTH